MKKALSVWLSLAIILSCMLVPGLSVSAASDHTGSTFLINGNTFQGLSVSERTMADNGDGTYCFPYHIQQDELVRVYFTELNADGTTRDYTNDYYYKTFDFTTNTTQDITIVFDPDAYPYLSVEGEDIRPRYGNKYFYVYCIFEGQTQFSREDGLMTVDENGVYSVTYKNVQPCDAIFDVYVESAGEAILGFYGYNTFPAKITAPCDVTVYFEPAYRDGYREPDPEAYDFYNLIYDYYNDDCRIWATGDNLVPNHNVTLENVRFNYGEYPVKKAAENVYYTVMQNVPSDKSDYYQAEAEKPDYDMFYVDRELGYPVEITETTEIDAKLYPIYYTTFPIVFHSPYTYTNVKWTLDATGLDYVTKEGAKFRFELIDMVKDVDMDGAYTIGDATALQRALAEFDELTDNQRLAADVNGDKEVNIVDVTELQRYLAKQ